MQEIPTLDKHDSKHNSITKMIRSVFSWRGHFSFIEIFELIDNQHIDIPISMR